LAPIVQDPASCARDARRGHVQPAAPAHLAHSSRLGARAPLNTIIHGRARRRRRPWINRLGTTKTLPHRRPRLGSPIAIAITYIRTLRALPPSLSSTVPWWPDADGCPVRRTYRHCVTSRRIAIHQTGGDRDLSPFLFGTTAAAACSSASLQWIQSIHRHVDLASAFIVHLSTVVPIGLALVLRLGWDQEIIGTRHAGRGPTPISDSGFHLYMQIRRANHLVDVPFSRR
jgi:hypothetical protein